MKKFFFIALLLIPVLSLAEPFVVIKTNMGNIEVELNQKQAPISTANFLRYVDSGFYKNTIFHRVIPNFMIQGGGFTKSMAKKITKAEISNEATNGLKNKRGTIAMARTNKVDSATSQFFINHSNNSFLDHKSKTPRGYGYAVFGRVVKGLDVVDNIAIVKTGRKKGMNDVPIQPVIIQALERLKNK
ncbi:MAG: peptidylprolyl isomerase [Thermodesulfobacteriota bacterium]|nr:peptidylprolyl isomerase [Thermodesulfobacteriota bacterium]